MPAVPSAFRRACQILDRQLYSFVISAALTLGVILTEQVRDRLDTPQEHPQRSRKQNAVADGE